jgi:hypothetical protein
MNKEGYILNIENFLHLLKYVQLMSSDVTSLHLVHDCYK